MMDLRVGEKVKAHWVVGSYASGSGWGNPEHPDARTYTVVDVSSFGATVQETPQSANIGIHEGQYVKVATAAPVRWTCPNCGTLCPHEEMPDIPPGLTSDDMLTIMPWGS